MNICNLIKWVISLWMIQSEHIYVATSARHSDANLKLTSDDLYDEAFHKCLIERNESGLHRIWVEERNVTRK